MDLLAFGSFFSLMNYVISVNPGAISELLTRSRIWFPVRVQLLVLLATTLLLICYLLLYKIKIT